jgi:hypothetical protein
MTAAELDTAPGIAQGLRESAAACSQEQCWLAARLTIAANMLERLYAIVVEEDSCRE